MLTYTDILARMTRDEILSAVDYWQRKGIRATLTLSEKAQLHQALKALGYDE